MLIYTAARVGAVAGLRRGSLAHDGNQWSLRFAEKRGKSREIPLRHDLQGLVLGYLEAAGLLVAGKDVPLFLSGIGKTRRLAATPATAEDVWRMVKRRMKDAGSPGRLSPHSFRVTTITDLLDSGVPFRRRAAPRRALRPAAEGGHTERGRAEQCLAHYAEQLTYIIKRYHL